MFILLENKIMNTEDNFIGPVNIGNPTEFTMIELVEKILDLTKSKLVFQKLPQDDPVHRKPNISLAKNELNNWEPKVNLNEGLKKTIAYFKKLV